MRKIIIVPYKKSWLSDFEAEKELLIQSIPVKDLAIHHIGSTSVVDLAAKPIIDILIETKNIDELDQVEKDFESIGYECKGEFGIPGRRYYQKGGDNRTHQIHAFALGSIGAKRHLAFRDYLIANKQVANEYQDVKYNAAKKCNNDISLYCELKNDFVAHHEALAIKWAKIT